MDLDNGRMIGRESELGKKAGDYYLHDLQRDEKLSCILFPEYVDRCLKFVEQENADTDVAFIMGKMYGAFQGRDKTVKMQVALDGNAKIVGHSLVYMETMGRRGWVATVLQAKMDTAKGTRAVFDLALKEAEQWALGLGVRTMHCITAKESTMRLWRMRGFKEHRTIMLREIR